MPKSIEIDTDFNRKLLNIDDKLLYMITVKDSKILDDHEFDIVKQLVFLRNCKDLEIKIVNKNKFNVFVKKLNKLNRKLKLDYNIFRCVKIPVQHASRVSPIIQAHNKTVVQLKKLAKEMGLKGYSKLNKADLIKFINQF
jgi:hypothetical protein